MPEQKQADFSPIRVRVKSIVYESQLLRRWRQEELPKDFPAPIFDDLGVKIFNCRDIESWVFERLRENELPANLVERLM
jgi:hypothetical protein